MSVVLPDPTLLLALGGLTVLVVRGHRQAARDGRTATSRAEVVRSVAAVTVLLVALGPAMEARADASLAAHMLQHQLLTLVAAPLLVTAGVWRALAGAVGRPLPTLPGVPSVAAGVAVGAAALHLGVLLVWHVPALYVAALASPALHHLEHLTMLGSAVLLWAAVLHAGRDLQAIGGAVAGLALLAIGGAALGVLLLAAPVPLYGWYGDGAAALDQQRIGGAFMKTGALLVYAGTAAVLTARWFQALEDVEVVPAPRPAAGGR